MHHAHIKAILEGVIPEVKNAIAAAVDPLIVRIGDIEQAKMQPAEKGEPGRDGIDGKDGQSITVEDVRPLLEEMAKEIPVPKDGSPGEPGRDGKDAAPLELQQVVEAIKTFDVEQLVADTIAGEYGIDVVAPDGVAKEMAAAVALLAQPLVRKETPVAVQQSTRPRKMTFERDEHNRIVAAIEE